MIDWFPYWHWAAGFQSAGIAAHIVLAAVLSFSLLRAAPGDNKIRWLTIFLLAKGLNADRLVADMFGVDAGINYAFTGANIMALGLLAPTGLIFVAHAFDLPLRESKWFFPSMLALAAFLSVGVWGPRISIETFAPFSVMATTAPIAIILIMLATFAMALVRFLRTLVAARRVNGMYALAFGMFEIPLAFSLGVFFRPRNHALCL
jgi:hypothetical protein